jgi:hypothetical protein
MLGLSLVGCWGVSQEPSQPGRRAGRGLQIKQQQYSCLPSGAGGDIVWKV